MSEFENGQNPVNEEPVKEQAQYTPSVQAEFMREKIKQKPVNKKKAVTQDGNHCSDGGGLWAGGVLYFSDSGTCH